MSTLNFPSFNPPFGLRGQHSQTIYAALTRPRRPVLLRRVRLGTDDGDFIDIDYADVDGYQLPETAPIVLLLHGLEGSASSHYAKNLYYLFAQKGLRAVGINYRSCSGEMNRSARFYHAGATYDVRFVHDYLREQHGDCPFGILGISLGANMLLKYLGENGGERSAWVNAAVSVSPFFDMNRSSKAFDSGTGRFYAQRLLKSLLNKLSIKQDELRGLIDVDRALAVEKVSEFDDLVTAPLGGFASAVDYYTRNSSGQFLPTVKAPTLLIRALDDPFFDSADIPHETIAANPHLTPLLTNHGGHVGFVNTYTGNFWAGDQAVRFLAHHLHGQ